MGILLGLSSNLIVNQDSRLCDSTKDKEYLEASMISGRIHIIDNSGWVTFKNAGNCTGQGTSSNPYIIADLVIDGKNSGDCIWIENSDVYFKIENCRVFNAWGSIVYYAGIRLDNVSNGRLYNNIISDNYYGIRLEESDFNLITGNVANESFHYGIYLSDCQNNLISRNLLANGESTGMILSTSNSNTILENIISDNSFRGIQVGGRNNGIFGNVINNNLDYGIILYSQCDNNQIWNNCLNNTLNARDAAYGLVNYWDSGEEGNFWADYTGVDDDGDGIGDVPYDISGLAGNQDNCPLMECPLSLKKGETAISGFNIFILIILIPIVAIFISDKSRKLRNFRIY